jgi:hypothetical protein
LTPVGRTFVPWRLDRRQLKTQMKPWKRLGFSTGGTTWRRLR